MKRKIVFWMLALSTVLALAGFSALSPAMAQSSGVQLSGNGCTVRASFDATNRTTYLFEVFAGADLLDEQSYTPQPDTTLPAPVEFSFTYTGSLPAPTISITIYAGDDVLVEFSEITALTSGCQPQTPPPPADNDDEPPAPAPVTSAIACGADLSGAVVGSFVAPADLYLEPGVVIEPRAGIAPGQTAWVLGVDASGEYYKIQWSCGQFWVPVETMGPNYDDVWNGAPLPTAIVE